MEKHIYADNAATTKLDIEAFEAMKPFLLEEFGNASQPYSLSRTPKKAISEARNRIAKCINAEPNEIFFTSGGTESDNWAIKGIATSNFEKKATITSCIEHHAVLNSCRAIEKMGYPVAYLPATDQGVVMPASLESYITANTKLVSIMMANNEIGTIQPIKELATIAHANGALFHTDAVQAVGHVPIDVRELGIDMLSASAHKFNGPKGIGFLYIKHGIDISPLHDGGSQEFGQRAGTEDVASIVGMAVALENNCDSIKETQKHIALLEDHLIEELKKVGVKFIRNGSISHIPGNVSLSFPNIEGETILHRMDLMGISISTGSACDSVNTKVSHVIEAIGVPTDYANGTIRISLGKNNTIDECNRIVYCLSKIISKAE